jgi:hypothetical protein
MSRDFDQSFSQSLTHSLPQSVSHSFTKSINQSINQSISQSVSKIYYLSKIVENAVPLTQVSAVNSLYIWFYQSHLLTSDSVINHFY